MRIGHWLAIIVLLAACEKPPVTAPSPTPAGPSGAPAAKSTPLASTSPSPAGSPAAEADDDADDDDDDDMAKPWGPEFEIDADANWYFGWVPMVVSFTTKPLNGSPPFTYTWHFDDGSPDETGETAQHVYTEPRTYNPSVTGKDGNGETYMASFFIRVVTREEYGERKGIDPAALPTAVPSMSPPSPIRSTPSPAPTR